MVACEIKAEFFHPDRIFILLQLVMNNCLQLSQGEIEEWNHDPETFYTAQEGSLLCFFCSALNLLLFCSIYVIYLSDVYYFYEHFQ